MLSVFSARAPSLLAMDSLRSQGGGRQCLQENCSRGTSYQLRPRFGVLCTPYRSMQLGKDLMDASWKMQLVVGRRLHDARPAKGSTGSCIPDLKGAFSLYRSLQVPLLYEKCSLRGAVASDAALAQPLARPSCPEGLEGKCRSRVEAQMQQRGARQDIRSEQSP